MDNFLQDISGFCFRVAMGIETPLPEINQSLLKASAIKAFQVRSHQLVEEIQPGDFPGDDRETARKRRTVIDSLVLTQCAWADAGIDPKMKLFVDTYFNAASRAIVQLADNPQARISVRMITQQANETLRTEAPRLMAA